MRTMIAAGLATAALAVGAGAGIEHTILHGVEVGKVHVWVGPDELPGASQEQLQTSTQSQLREAGIEIRPGAPATLFVNVVVQTWPHPDLASGPVSSDPRAFCFANIESSLVEDALLERNGLRVGAQSWRTGASIAGYSTDECVQHIPEGVERTVSDFIEMYSAMNPTAD